MLRGGLLSIPVWLMLMTLGIGGFLLFNYSRSLFAPRAPEYPIVSAAEIRLTGLRAGGVVFDLSLLCSEPEDLRTFLSEGSESFILKDLDAKIRESFPGMREAWLAKGTDPEFQREFEIRLRALVNKLLPSGSKGRALDATVSNLRTAD